MNSGLIKTALLVFTISVITFQSINALTYFNSACRFGGVTNSYLSVPNSPSLNITGGFTIEFWMLPQSISGTQTIVSKGSTLANRYGMQLINNRVAILSDGAVELQSAPFTPFVWTHIAGTYNSSTHQFRIYINGVLDTSRTNIGAQPSATTDSLFIGSLPGSALPFLGKLDEIRIWNKELSATLVSGFFRTSLSESSGIYSGLVMSLTFNSQFSGFELLDQTDNNNDAFNRGAFQFDQSNRPNHTISPNESVQFDGNEDYLASPDRDFLSPVLGITLECWVYPRSTSPCILITKGTDYRLGYSGAVVTFGLNNNFFPTGTALPINQWSHIALSYTAASGIYSFYLNGILKSTATIAVGNIPDGTDSLYIGGGPGFGDFNGYLDEVIIRKVSSTQSEIIEFMYQSPNSVDLGASAFFNFDGSIGSLFFRNNARFSHPACFAGQPISPISRNDVTNFTPGYYINTSNKRIPAAGTSGTTTDSTIVNLSINVTDVNLFVALNHTNLSNLDITLIGPNGDSLKVLNNNFTNSLDNNLATIFNDQADSSLINDRYSSFSTVIKPLNNINTMFSGDNSRGKWKLIIRDEAANDTGFLYAWGIQINNMSLRAKDLNVSALIQGFYKPATNLMVSDTIKVNLRHHVSPFQIMATSKTVVTDQGLCFFNFSASVNEGQTYRVQLIHRNSIETWGNPITFINHEANYSFTDAASSAVGNNQIQVDNSPVRFAIYSGDVNQDGIIDASDLSAVDNNAFNAVSGYVKTDLNGDDFVDASDLSIADNNAFSGIIAITP